MIALDTNILARFYVDDPGDMEAAKQRPAAYRLLTDSPRLFVPMSVILELEWVLRAFYRFDAADFVRVVRHLLGLPNVTVEEWPRIADALDAHTQGIDFADAMHLFSSSHCEELATFDDRRFARRANHLGLKPIVNVPRLGKIKNE